jgi:hypothetical protein
MKFWENILFQLIYLNLDLRKYENNEYKSNIV